MTRQMMTSIRKRTYITPVGFSQRSRAYITESNIDSRRRKYPIHSEMITSTAIQFAMHKSVPNKLNRVKELWEAYVVIKNCANGTILREKKNLSQAG